MQIASRTIGPRHPAYIIAEIGVNHDGDPQRALQLVDAAADAGADAVKFQFFDAGLLMSRAAALAAYQASAGETDPISMLRRLQLPEPALAAAAERAHARGIHAIVTCFSLELVARAEPMGWDAFKTASPDIVHRPLLEALVATGLPLVVSTGAAEYAEVERAMHWLRPAAGRTALLQCVSSYPTPQEAAELGGILALGELHPAAVGYSDHTPDDSTGALAVRAGACILEKHLTHSRGAAGPDHAASLEPAGLARYIAQARGAYFEPAFGASLTILKRVTPRERDVRRVSRQSIVARRALRAGELVRAADLTFKRPGTGIPPCDLAQTVGRALARDVAADMPLALDDLA